MTELRIEEDFESDPGHALIHLLSVTAPVGEMGFRLSRRAGDPPDLGRHGWQIGEPDMLIRPREVLLIDGHVALRVGPEVVDHLAYNTPIELEVPDVGVRVRANWPDIAPSPGGPSEAVLITAGRKPAPETKLEAPPAPPPPPPQTVAAPSPPLAPPPPEPVPEATSRSQSDLADVAEVTVPPAKPSANRLPLVLAALLLLLAAGGGGWWFMQQQDDKEPVMRTEDEVAPEPPGDEAVPEPPAEEDAPETVADPCTSERLAGLAGDGMALLSFARECAEADSLLAFEALRRCEEQGETGECLYEFGRCYDPRYHGDALCRFAEPAGDLAGDYYLQAADRGVEGAVQAHQGLCAFLGEAQPEQMALAGC